MSKSSEKVKAWRKNTKQRMVDSMGGKCQCCGYNKCIEALDFHHLDPKEKEMSMASIRANPTAWINVVRELRKCILICRNCHGEIHYGHRQIPEKYQTFDEKYLDYQNSLTPETSDTCPSCGQPKLKFHQFCSLACAGSARRRIKWENYDLQEMLKAKSKANIADEIGCSIAGLQKHLKKMALAVGNAPTCSV